MHADELIEYIKIPKWDRIFRIKDALMAGISVEHYFESTKVLTAGLFTRYRKSVIVKKKLQNMIWKHFRMNY